MIDLSHKPFTRGAWALALGAVFIGGSLAQDQESPPATPKKLELLKGLEGDWEADQDEDGQPDVEVQYRVTAGGSAVIETLMPGTGHEMVIVYHADGEGLLLTHYCAMGNQPRLKGAEAAQPNQLLFEYLDGTNIPEGGMHIHSLLLTVHPDGRLQHRWSTYKGGSEANRMEFTFKRKASEE